MTDFDTAASTITDAAGRTTFYLVDADGNLVNITDPDGSSRQFAYDSNSRLIFATSERGFTTSYDYGFAGEYLGSGFPDGASIALDISRDLGLADLGIGLGTEVNPAPFGRPANQMAELTDGNGNVTVMRLDEFGQPIEITDPIGRTTTIERNPDGLATRVTQPSDGELPDGSTPGQLVTELDYDERGNVTARRQAVGTTLERQTTFEYEPVFNQVTRVTDPAGFETLFAYDPLVGHLNTITDALGGQRSFTYGAGGLVVTTRDKNLNLIQFTYDSSGNLEKFIDAEANELQFSRDLAGNATFVVHAAGTPDERSFSYTYDSANRVLTRTDGVGATITFHYDAAGNRDSITDGEGLSRVFTYDSLNRLAQIEDPTFGIQNWDRDLNGNVINMTDPLADTWQYEYDPVNRLTKSIDPLLNEQIFTHDVQDNPKTVQDGNGNATQFSYDILNRVKLRTNPLGQTWGFGFDIRDNLVNIVDPKQQPIAGIYDPLSRLTRIDTPDDVITFNFDAVGNLLTAIDGDSSLSFTYDALNRVRTAATDPGGVQPVVTLTSVYDAVGNRRQLLDSGGATTLFDYDPVARLVRFTSAANDIVDLTRGLNGRVEKISFPNLVVSDFLYDPNGRLETLQHDRDLTQLTQFGYTYDAGGNVITITELGGIRNHAYDPLQRLVAAGTQAASESYAYDAAGNRVTSHLSASHVTDAANRLVQDDSFCYAHDDNGNLVTKTAKAAGACGGDVTGYTYDALNRLIRIDFPDLTSASYRYDAFGRRIEKNVAGVVTRYLYDGEAIVLEYDATGTPLARYGHGDAVDQPLVMQQGGQSYFYHADRLGSIRLITDANGNVVNSYAYDSYGRFEEKTEAVANPYTFVGREFDEESGLYYYRARYYDPNTGRFLQEDPLGFKGRDLNLYRYVGSNPTNYVDPFGLFLGPPPTSPTTTEYALGVASALRAAPGLLAFGNALRNYYVYLASLFTLGWIILPDEPEEPEPQAEPSGPPALGPGGPCGPTPPRPGEPTEKHHSDPKVYGGDPNQPTTTMGRSRHNQLHKAMWDFMSMIVDENGNHMRPQPGNSGFDIRRNFTRQQRLDALRDFYNGPGSRYPDAARDFFNQDPTPGEGPKCT